MAKTITTTLTIAIVGDGLNETHAYQAVNPAGAPALFQPKLTGSPGWGSTLYPGMAGALYVPPSPSGVAKTLVGSAIDTGVAMDPSKPALVMLVSGQTFGVNLGASHEDTRVKLL